MQHKSKIIWIAGAFYFGDQDEGQVKITVYPRATQIRPFSKIEGNAGALFGQATYKMSSRVSLTGGVRYTAERKNLRNTGGEYMVGTGILAIRRRSMTTLIPPPSTPGPPRPASRCRYRRDTFVYASATRGFKSGGFNIHPRTEPGGPSTPSSPGVLKVA